MEPKGVSYMALVKTPEEARLKVDHWVERGATSIKIYFRMRSDILAATIEQAHERGVKVVGHIGAATYKEAIEMGIDELNHGFFAFPDVMPQGLDPRDYAKWNQAVSETNFNQPKVREILKSAVDRKVVFTPTVIGFEPANVEKHHLQEQKKYYTTEGWNRIEKLVQETNPSTAIASKEIMMGVVKKNLEFIRMAHDAGGILTTGTNETRLNILPGFALWREMELFTETGLKPMEILKAATVSGAFALGRTDQLGSVEAGKLADFVILNTNPLENISNVRSVHRVVKGGIIYEPEQLLKPLIGTVQ